MAKIASVLLSIISICAAVYYRSYNQCYTREITILGRSLKNAERLMRFQDEKIVVLQEQVATTDLALENMRDGLVKCTAATTGRIYLEMADRQCTISSNRLKRLAKKNIKEFNGQQTEIRSN